MPPSPSLPERLNLAIEAKAGRLAEFTCIDGARIGIENARERLKAWCANFLMLPEAGRLLPALLDHIRFVSDQDIVDDCMRFLQHNVPAPDDARIFCPLGNENESSLRIMRLMNGHPRFCSGLTSALEKAGQIKGQTPMLVFIDDFLNTGGQFRRIVQDWFTPDGLSPLHRECLKKTRLLFLFFMGKEDGRIQAENILENYGLNGKIHILGQYPLVTCFGDADDLDNIRQQRQSPIKKEAFTGLPASDLSDFLDICECAGDQLLRICKPEWEPEKYAARRLGYGNEGQLLVGQNNFPTCTLTCLWLGGRIRWREREIEWVPLFDRRTKQAGIEATVALKPDSPRQMIRAMRLDPDAGRNSDVPLEVILLHETCGSIDDASVGTDAEVQLESVLPTDTYARMFGTDRPLVRIRRMDAGCYAKLNNHLAWHHTSPNHHAVHAVIRSIDFIQSGKVVLVGSRFKIHARGIPLSEAARLAPDMRVARTCRVGRETFNYSAAQNSTVAATARQLLQATLEQAQFPLRLSAREPRVLAFFRIDETSARSMEPLSILHLVGDLRNPKTICFPAPASPHWFGLDFDAWLSVNERGTVMMCRAGHAINRSALQQEFATVYYAFEALVQAAILSDETQDGLALRRELEALVRPAGLQNPHQRRHLELLLELFGERKHENA